MAVEAFSLAIQHDSENIAGKHFLASLTEDEALKRRESSYVKIMFDDMLKRTHLSGNNAILLFHFLGREL
jgi:hypothetical protein